MRLKLMTFNIQHCLLYKEGRIDYKPFAEEILSSGASITGLNEVRGKGEREDYEAQCEILSSLTGYEYYFAKALDVNGKNPYGNGILSACPIISAETIPIPDPVLRAGKGFETRCILKAVIDAGARLNVFVTHMGLNPSERKNAVKKLCEILPDEKTVLMGDFNCTPDDRVLLPLYEKMKLSDKEAFTFPSDRPSSKIDYIMFTPDIRLIKSETGENIVSDHRNQRAEILIEE